MIAGIFHQGSGLGNQLFRYITVRTLAEDKNVSYSMIWSPDNSGKEIGFKGKFFLEQPIITWQYPVSFKMWDEKKVVENGVDIRGYDPEINFIEDDTIIDGEFQDIRYWEHRLKDIDKWLKIEPLEVDGNLCIIGFRGGEYALYSDLFLTKEYWDDAISKMKLSNPNMHFEVHTDDVALAQNFFPDFKCIHDIALNWRSVRYAKYAIIANSSFYILPRLLRHNEPGTFTIAPRYWARHNTKTWALPQNYYPSFFYI